MAMLSDLQFSSSFLDRSDKHKYARLWAGKAHRKIAAIMRAFPVDVIHDTYPHCFFYIKKFLQIMYEKEPNQNLDDYVPAGTITKGILKDAGIQYLYRGISEDTDISNSAICDPSFISFSIEKEVAVKFARDIGYVFQIAVKDLPEDFRGYSINREIDPVFLESEIVLPPGMLSFQYKKTLPIATNYTPNQETIAVYMSKQVATPTVVPDDFEDGAAKTYKHKMTDSKVAGKTVVFYRAIAGCPIEFKNIYILSKNPATLHKQLEENISKYVDNWNHWNYIIPEYARLRKEAWRKDLSLSDRCKVAHVIESYDLHAAVFDEATGTLITPDITISPRMFKELYKDIDAKTLEEGIRDYLSHRNIKE